ncbi:SIMPL domain-containing protein [Patiriisocius marinistellae]|uniref:SIMPL domain-containing protein n=1 Tax=Patiriisocius marinistellae TaxID=2494560 RepID=A0A5J4G1X1_9FLAO|nr:SIMPL domain-containing protein [Patiriisocius marinistellae]GEQ86061.1 SIMPL domain-containing protein [Patiriisocius marinistellae]
MKASITAIIFGFAIVIASAVLGNAFMNRNKAQRTIAVTGLGKSDFTSDLIVWEARFTRNNTNLQQAYKDLESDKNKVTQYLTNKGVPNENIVFSAVSTSENNEPNYGPNGNYIGTTFTGYNLSQSVEINSKNVAAIETISREITELLNQGVQLYSAAPRYYYTKIEDLKIEMISRATENARLRAEKIAENSGSGLGELVKARMGIFQITGQNSGEDYSWGGAYNTSSKEKTTSITMKLTYNVD